MDIMMIIDEEARKIAKMREDMIALEEKYMLAKADYETANEILEKRMSDSGIFSCVTDSGSKVELVSKVSCTITKDKKHDVALWLRKMGMEDKVKVTATVKQDYIPLLAKSGIEYQENEDVNTNTVKSLLTSMIKENKMDVNSIPKGITYTQVETVQIDGR